MYIQNRSTHAIVGVKTAEEVFTGKKPVVDHMRIFGTTVYIHVPKEKRAKLEPSGKKGIFVGYRPTRRPNTSMYLDRGRLKSAEM